MPSSSFCHLRLVLDRSTPVHLVSDSRGGTLSLKNKPTNKIQTKDGVLVSKIGLGYIFLSLNELYHIPNPMFWGFGRVDGLVSVLQQPHCRVKFSFWPPYTKTKGKLHSSQPYMLRKYKSQKKFSLSFSEYIFDCVNFCL